MPGRSGLNVEGFAAGNEAAAGKIVDAAPLLVREVPAVFGERRRIGPGRDHLAKKQVIGLLDMRLDDDPAFEPGQTIVYQRRADQASRRAASADF